MSPKIIISGGQTGADMGGLRAAKQLGIATSGWAPKDYWTEKGSNPELGSVYSLMEHETKYDYAPRTAANVEMADATVIFGRRSPGSNLTESLCAKREKPLLWLRFPIDTLTGALSAARFRIWLAQHDPLILNVAGNRESVTPGIELAVMQFLLKTLV